VSSLRDLFFHLEAARHFRAGLSRIARYAAAVLLVSTSWLTKT